MPSNVALGAEDPEEMEKYYYTPFTNGKLNQREMKLVVQLESKRM